MCIFVQSVKLHSWLVVLENWMWSSKSPSKTVAVFCLNPLLVKLSWFKNLWVTFQVCPWWKFCLFVTLFVHYCLAKNTPKGKIELQHMLLFLWPKGIIHECVALISFKEWVTSLIYSPPLLHCFKTLKGGRNSKDLLSSLCLVRMLAIVMGNTQQINKNIKHWSK